MTPHMQAFVARSRWFGGKGRDFEVVDSRRLALPRAEDTDPDTGRTVVVELLTLRYADTGQTDLYQVPVAYYGEEQGNLHHALIGHWDDERLGHVWAYDALHDHAATPLWLCGFVQARTSPDIVFHRVGEPDLDVDSRSTVLTGEQSNSSVKFGDASIMKLFRRVTPGANPDIEILEALTLAGNEHVAALYGWVEAVPDGPDGSSGEPLQLGILQQFLRTASDGWELALASLRSLFGASELSPEESGGDFAAEAHRLGVSVAEMHASLAASFPTESWDRPRMSQVADTMSRRLEEAAAVVPEIRPYAPRLHSVFDAARHLDRPVPAQRVHGDLHLGQTLRTVRNWKIIDFEGEPAKSLEERRSLDSPWRDVAGMLRSFDYAAEMSRRDQEQVAADVGEVVHDRGREWADRNVEAFLTGYRTSAGIPADDPGDQVLLNAYAADKAVYEAVYEARNRPSWLPIPLAALARLVR
jgi:maltokinase